MAVIIPSSFRPAGRRNVRLPGVAIALLLGLGIQGCTGEGSAIPPGEILALSQPVPIILPEPQAPANYPVLEPASSLPVDPPFAVASGPAPASAGAAPQFLPEPAIDPVRTQALDPAGQGGVPVAEPEMQAPETRFAFLPRISNPMAKPEWAGGLPAEERACRQRLKRLGVTFRDIPAIGSEQGCGIPHPVELIALSGGIKIKPAAKVNCQITEAFARWVEDELAPAARMRYLSGIKSINQLSSYSCRTMNSRRGAPMSEHSRGNAIDVGKITLNSGKSISVRKPGFFAFREKSLLNNVRADSCKYFTTVLGPGSDVHHKDHFHFDLRKRKSGYRHCDL